MTNNYIIIHGSFGTPFSNWFEWLNDELTKKNKSVIVPQFPIGVEVQNYDNWSRVLKAYLEIGLINEKTTLIGHSIAPIFITKFLLENKINVSKLIFISGFNNFFLGSGDYDLVNKTFFTDNVKDIHNYCKNITCFYSDNDPYLPLKVLEEFTKETADKKIVIKNGGHLNTESGYEKFEELLEELQ